MNQTCVNPFQVTITLLIALAVGCEREKTVATLPPRPVLSIIAAPSGGPRDGYSGIIESRYETNLGFRILGQMIMRDVQVGDSVAVGQRLATLDPVVLENSVQSAKATLANAQTQAANAKSSLQRQVILRAKNATSESEYELAKKTDEAARATVIQTQSDLDKANEELGYAELKSDIAGVVEFIDAERGETVTAGQMIFKIADPTQREAVVDIGEDVIDAVKTDSEFLVTLQSDSSAQCVGKVREIAPQADAKTRTRRVRISLIDPPESLRLGATIKAIPQAELPSKLRLPLTAVLKRDDGTFVWVVNEEQQVVNRVPITIGAQDDSGVEITSGVRDGDRVVVAGVHSLKDGQTVRIQARASR